MTSNLVRTSEWDTRWVSAVINYKGSKVEDYHFSVSRSADISNEFKGEVTGSDEEGFELHIVVDGAVRPTSEKPYVIALPETMKVNSYGVSEVTVTYQADVTNVSEVDTGTADATIQFDTVSVNPELPDGNYSVAVSGSCSAVWTSDNGLAVTGFILDKIVENEIGNNTPISVPLETVGTVVVGSGTPSMYPYIAALQISVEGDTISTSNGAVTEVTVGDVVYKTDTDTYTR